jgi:hypothetical protein
MADEKTLPDMIWDQLSTEIADLQTQVNALTARTERSETTSGHPTATIATLPLAANGAKGGDQLFVSDAVQIGSANLGAMANYDPATDSWLVNGSAPGSQAAFMPRRATMWMDESTVLVGAALLRIGPGTSEIYGHMQQNPGANGDTFTNSFVIAAGVYTFYVLGNTNTDQGAVDWYIDNVRVVTAQNWNAALAGNVLKTATVTIPYSGYHVLKGVATGYLRFAKMYLAPSAD